jgi:hypothetical protein
LLQPRPFGRAAPRATGLLDLPGLIARDEGTKVALKPPHGKAAAVQPKPDSIADITFYHPSPIVFVFSSQYAEYRDVSIVADSRAVDDWR